MNTTATYTEPVNRIKQRILIDGNLENMACCCDDWSDFVIEISEWGIDHLGGVDFDDPEVNVGLMNAFFGSFGCTPDNPHPCSKYALGV